MFDIHCAASLIIHAIYNWVAVVLI